jgi:predicted nucleotidyltransferase
VDSVEQFESVLKEWASSAPSVRRVWVYGNAAKGSANPNDLDVAVELDTSDPVLLWSDRASGWRRELQERLPTKLHLEWFDPDGTTPTISVGLSEGARLIYERAR